MASHAGRTIRVTEVPTDVSREIFDAAATDVVIGSAKKRGIFWNNLGSSSSVNECTIRTSLAPQFGDQVGTITLSSVRQKEPLIKTLKEKNGWNCDDVFDGITVLYESATADLE